MAIQGVIAGQDAGESATERQLACALGDCYRCADGRFIVLAIVNVDREYPLLCEALGHKDWLSDERFATIYDVLCEAPGYLLCTGV